MARLARRLLAAGVYAAAGAAVWFLAVSPLLSRGDSGPGTTAQVAAAEVVKTVARPKNVPGRIPAWAWRLYRWHALDAAKRGPRPQGVPKVIPDWYWAWRTWRVANARLAEAARTNS